MAEVSVLRLMERIQTEGDAYELLEELRWGTERERQSCPKCGSVRRFYFIKPRNGSRSTRTGAETQRRRWKCADCRHQFSVLTGTIFHGTKIPVRTWVLVIFEMCASKNGVAAREIERKYDVTNKTAWFMLHRIREAMKREPLAGMLRGTVVADGTFVGGKPKNRHRQGKTRPSGPGGKGRHDRVKPTENKTAVLSLVDKATGEVRSQVVPDVTGATLRKAIAEQVDMGDTTLHTDGYGPYRAIGAEMAGHEYVDHSRAEYVRGEVSTNQAENYFSQLKRSIDGTHHNVSDHHLPRYLAEFDFRYSTRELTDGQRMGQLLGQVEGRRLTYRPVRAERD